MTVPDATVGADGGARLVLRLVRCRGLPCIGAFDVPPAGAGVAAALMLGGPPLSPADSEDADRCAIARIDGQWVLTNQSRSMVCALNGQRIGVGKRPALFDGDVLELGLLRFEVDAMHGPGHGVAEFDVRHRASPPGSVG